LVNPFLFTIKNLSFKKKVLAKNYDALYIAIKEENTRL